jgi:DNA repair protein RecO (recombination protein O)
MLRLEAQPAYILHSRPYRETSLLIDAFTRDHGRIGLIARGVRGTRGQPLRAVLQPMQALLVSCAGQGELLKLVQAEAADAPQVLTGNALLSGFYLNELLLRLVPRGEVQTGLFWRYVECIAALAAGIPPAWELRRFERDLLAAIGYAIDLRGEASAEPVQPDLRYRVDPEHGLRRTGNDDVAPGACAGAALLALADDQAPDPVHQRELRRLMRTLLLHHLGGRELKSWQVLAEVSREGK